MERQQSETGSEQGLLTNKNTSSNRPSSTLKWALIAVAIVVIVIVTVTLVALIFIKINQLENEIKIGLDTSTQLDQQRKTTTGPKQPMTQKLTEPAPVVVRPVFPDAGQSISLSRDPDGPTTYTADNWVFDDWVYSNPDYDVIDNAYITIKTAGIYTIQAQVSFRMRTGIATYQIKKKRAGETTGKSLSQCITTFDKKYAQQKSCFTSTTSYMKPGDQIFVDIFNDNLTVDFKDGKSTFGVVKIQGLASV